MWKAEQLGTKIDRKPGDCAARNRAAITSQEKYDDDAIVNTTNTEHWVDSKS